MRISAALVAACALIQVILGASIDDIAEQNLENALSELTKEQEIELIETLLRKEEHTKREHTDPYSEVSEAPSFASMVEDLVEESLESQRSLAGRTLQEEHKAVQQLASYLAPTPNERAIGKSASAYLDAIKSYKQIYEKKRGLAATKEEFWREVTTGRNALRVISRTRWEDEEIPFVDEACYDITTRCRKSKFRTFDGTCNNLINPELGSTERTLKRNLPPDYADDISEPRVSNNPFFPLPSARNVSLMLDEASDIADDDIVNRTSLFNTMHLMLVGQFLDHDLAHTPAFEPEEVECPCDSTNPKCFNIPTPGADHPWDCLPFRRSLPAHADNCELTFLEHGNSITAWIDGSQIYGENLSKSRELRDMRDETVFGRAQGRMLTRTNPISERSGDQILPPISPCPFPRRPEFAPPRCEFFGGDIRASEQPSLASMHTLFVRLHNVFEEQIFRFNPELSPEILYQHTRRLVTAVWQNIAVNEFLPIILGKKAFFNFGLEPNRFGYNPNLDPTIAQSFSTAAFRFGHTLVAEFLEFGDKLGRANVKEPLATNFWSPNTLYDSPVAGIFGVDSLMAGFTKQPAENYDSKFAVAIRELLFGDGEVGMDLPALNVQRGRDHGVPGYGHWLDFCGFNINFSRLRRKARREFRRLYSTNEYGNVRIRARNKIERINDTDLFAAGIAEKPIDGSLVGPTFNCIIGRQFSEIKNGDRFYFTHQEAGFSIEQIRNILGFKLSSVLCATTDVPFFQVQEKSLLQPWDGFMSDAISPSLNLLYPGETNRRVPCDELPTIDFRLFRDLSSFVLPNPDDFK